MLREKRTRTLVQIGGLAEKAGILDLLGIRRPDHYMDLQLGGPEAARASAVLYGAMLELADKLADPQHMKSLQERGVSKFREEEKNEEDR
jgi:hypothetical protein